MAFSGFPLHRPGGPATNESRKIAQNPRPVKSEAVIEPESDSEPQPIDPKEASRIIGEHLRTKRRSPPSPPAPDRAGEGEEEEILAAGAIRLDDIVDLLQRNPELLLNQWVRENDESRPLRAKKVSYAEIELIVGRRSS